MSTNPKVRINTNKGPIILELFPEKAPKTVTNFLDAVDSGHYDGTIFHRVISGFMIQGGGMDENLKEKSWGKDPVPNEAADSIANKRGTISMARTMDPHSATVQFFINTVDNASLDHKSPTAYGYGYCAFGEVTEGMDIVNAIEAVETHSRGMHQDVPKESVLIESAKRI